MCEREYARADAEVIAVVDENHRNRRNTQAVEEEATVRRQVVNRHRENTEARRRERIRGMLSVGARAALGILILGAVTREWIVPGLGIAAALVCFGWAIVAARHRPWIRA